MTEVKQRYDKMAAFLYKMLFLCNFGTAFATRQITKLRVYVKQHGTGTGKKN
jgi:hypothetical protein